MLRWTLYRIMNAEPATPPPSRTSRIGEAWVSVRAIVALLVFVVLVACVLLYCIWAFWPTQQAQSPGGVIALREDQKLVLFGARFTASLDVVLFVIVAAAGALGGIVLPIRSLAWYVGNRH